MNSAAQDIAASGMDRPLQRRPKWYVWPGLLCAVAMFVAGVIWLTPARGSMTVETSALETAVVRRGPFSDFLPLRGTVTPLSTNLVGISEGGRVELVLVAEGARVTANQPLARLSNSDLTLNVMTREADIAAKLGDISGQSLSLERGRLERARDIAEANYDLIKAKRELARRQQLRDKGLLAEAGVATFAEEAAYHENRLRQLQTGEAAETRISAQQGARIQETYTQLKKNLATVTAGLDALVVRAPASGVLTSFDLQPGQMLKAGDTVGQVDTDGRWKLLAEVDEFYLGRLQVGQRATAQRMDRPVQVELRKVLPQVTEGRFRVELAFVGVTPTNLRRGESIDLRLALGAAEHVLVAPNGAWVDGASSGSVFVVDPDGRHARRRPVTIGRRTPDQVEILAGLKSGERIVVSATRPFDNSDTLNLR